MPDIDWNYFWGHEIAAWQSQAQAGHYGDQWGNPEMDSVLRTVATRFIEPFTQPGHVGLEIGSGGGRWTQYLLNFSRLYSVELNAQSFHYLLERFGARPNLSFCRTNGTDFPGIPLGSLDYAFSFDVFVHLEPDLIFSYLTNLRTLLKPTANVFIHYADQTKPGVDGIYGFAKTDSPIFRALASKAGYEVMEEDTTTLWHSNIVRLAPVGLSAIQPLTQGETAVELEAADLPNIAAQVTGTGGQIQSFRLELSCATVQVIVEEKR